MTVDHIKYDTLSVFTHKRELFTMVSKHCLKLPVFVFEIADIHVSDRIFGKTAVKIFCPIDQLLSNPLQAFYRLLTEQWKHAFILSLAC